MNRTIVIVKAKPHEYRVIRIHWDEGQAIARWLTDQHPDHNAALRLIDQGHRHSVTEPHRIVCPEYEWFRTLTNARTWTEHTTLAYHNGKRWQFWHHGDPLRGAAPTLQGCTPEVGV